VASASGGGYTTSAGGAAFGGGLFSLDDFQMLRSTVNGNSVTGGPGATPSMPGPGTAGGDGVGGGFAAAARSLTLSKGSFRLLNSTFAANLATGGTGGLGFPAAGPGGAGMGGGIFADQDNSMIQNCTVAGNAAFAGSGAAGGGQATGGGLDVASGAMTVQNSIIAQSASGADTAGTFTSDHNLISVDPGLDSLAFNGGPTWTMALLPNSPAIDAGVNVVGVTTDQRGVTRPFGAAPDIGAFEWDAPSYTNLWLRSLQPAASGWLLTGTGPAAMSFHVQSTTNLQDWTSEAAGVTRVSGWFELETARSTNSNSGFFRLISP